MKTKISMLLILVLFGVSNLFAQLTLPRASPRQSISQTVGDTTVSIIYHRPNVKGREIWGKLVPFGEVWRTGANEATTFEVSNDVKISGQTLPKGKYSLHTIPNKDEWIVIFNKTSDQWGSFDYDVKQDALRVNVKPMAADFKESMSIEFENVTDNTTQVAIGWEKVRVPFTIDVGGVSKRILETARRNMGSIPIQAANYVINSKLTANYDEALGWLNESLRVSETYGALVSKSRLLNEMGKKDEAIKTAERAIQVGKASDPQANTSGLENLLKEWKAKK
ncbi:MAG: DUF2911 domain-containing protein [Acidobacteria bacterium]|jgi:hypothetical protein|nr:DUF2911 domain-containing protein [Acidobacteriota bacterium]